jgi:membrane protease YdiL (CAAX protease family)
MSAAMPAATVPGPAKRGVAVYLVLAFSMAWIPWSIAWFAGVSADNLLKFQMAILPGTFAPAIAAWLVRKWVTREGFADAGLRLTPFRLRYYVFALLLPFAVVVTIVMLAMILGSSRPDWSVQRALRVLMRGLSGSTHLPATPAHFWLVLPILLPLQSILVTPILWGEEFGWRGYLQLRLFAQRPLLAAVGTGLIWGVWHYPLILMGYQYPHNPFLGLIVFPVSTTLLSIIFGWLRLRSGSIWSTCVAHAATNAIGGSLIFLLFSGGPNWILVSYLGVFGWIPLAAVCAWILITGRLNSDRTLKADLKSPPPLPA